MRYSFNIQFKDGRIKIEPYITELSEKWAESKPERKYYINSSESPDPAEVNSIYMFSKKTGTSFLFQEEFKSGIENWFNLYVSALVKGLNDNW